MNAHTCTSKLGLLACLALSACGREAQSEHPIHESRHREAVAFNTHLTKALAPEFSLSDLSTSHPNVVRPVAEYEGTRTVAFSADFYFGSYFAKRALAQNLPPAVQLLVLGGVYNSWNATATDLGIPASRMTFQTTSDPGISDGGFWFRDAGPIALWGQAASGGAAVRAAMDTRNWKGFEPDSWLDPLLGALRIVPAPEVNYEFEGGNFMADTKGNCFLIDKAIPDAYFTYHFGCKTVTKLPCIKGICHLDESAKLLSDTDVVTDLDEYVPVFAGLGYTVHKLPRPAGTYETYVNSLLVNGTAFVPVFAEATDAQALAVYQSLGFKTVPLESRELSNHGQGSVHCITQTYPAL